MMYLMGLPLEHVLSVWQTVYHYPETFFRACLTVQIAAHLGTRFPTKKPARKRLHSQAGFSTLLPKIVKASGLGALPCLLVICVCFGVF